VTAEKLLILPGFTFQTFINSYIVSQITRPQRLDLG
jgi:hypothetical protein